jgi:hypothetical protein
MKAPRGYIAVVSAIIISSIITLAVFESSANVFIARFGQIDSEDKIRSEALAFSCAYEALYAYAEDSAYAPHGETIKIGQRENGIPEDCIVNSLALADTRLSIIVRASMGSAYTVLQVNAQNAPLSIMSWYEITSVPP